MNAQNSNYNTTLEQDQHRLSELVQKLGQNQQRLFEMEQQLTALQEQIARQRRCSPPTANK